MPGSSFFCFLVSRMLSSLKDLFPQSRIRGQSDCLEASVTSQVYLPTVRDRKNIPDSEVSFPRMKRGKRNVDGRPTTD